MSLDATFARLKNAQKCLARETGEAKNAALRSVAVEIENARVSILAANSRDVESAQESGMKDALLDRLRLNDERIDAIIGALEVVIAQHDPVGRVVSGWTLPNGLLIEKVTEPLGIVAVIYESRPNVTVDVFALAYKAGCAVLLRGGSAARETNRALVAAITKGLSRSGIQDALAFVDSDDRGVIDEIITARGKIDVVLPRGGRELIRRVSDNARVPVIETGEGNCHIYIEASADMQSAAAIVENAKLQKPGACNAVETLLIERSAAKVFLPLLASRLAGRCELRCDAESSSIVPTDNVMVNAATDDDWATEYLDTILAVKVVANVDEAVAHINTYGTGHSEAILTNNMESARKFCAEVDAACVYVNASTRFTDGGAFGFGAELGISTQKFHARGPLGLDALTTIKYRVCGNGQMRQ